MLLQMRVPYHLNLKFISMKNLFIVASCLFLFVSCDGTRSAERVADKFLKAYYVDFDFRQCKTLSTPASRSFIDNKENIIALSPFSEEESPDVKIINVAVVDAKYARCAYSLNKSEKFLFLVKQGRKWLVDAVESNLSENPGPAINTGGGFAVSTSISRSEREKKKE
jgi:hypothetical protein